MTEIKVHPLAEVLPLLDAEALQQLADDIRQNGQQQPILACRGTIIDGRNRLKACELANVEPEFLIRDDMTEPEIVAAIISANLHRRHLTTQQRAHIAAELANGARGGDRTKPSNEGLLKPPTIKEAAAALNVSHASVERAAAVKRADPEAHQAAMRGDREAVRQAKEVRERRSKPAPAGPATEAPSGTQRSWKPPAEVRPALEALRDDPEACRDTLRALLDYDHAWRAAEVLIGALSYRPYFARDVANAVLDRLRWEEEGKDAQQPPEPLALEVQP